MANDCGWPLTLLYAADYCLRKLSGERCAIIPYALVAQPIGRVGATVVRDDPRTVVAVLAPTDPLCAKLPRPIEVNLRRWQSGSRCHAAIVKGDLGGTIWTQRGGYDEDEVRCRFVLEQASTSSWDFDVYVEPSLRGGRTMARLWKGVDADLAQAGVQWSFSRISLFNAASLQSHARLGAQRVGYAVFLRLGQSQVCVMSIWPYLHLGLYASSRPTVTLRPPA